MIHLAFWGNELASRTPLNDRTNAVQSTPWAGTPSPGADRAPMPRKPVGANPADPLALRSHCRPNTRSSLAPAVVWRTGRAARVDEDQWTSVSDPFADGLRESGIRSEVASPIMVEGRLWGVVSAGTRGTFPSDTAERMADFTELVATAVGNAESRAQLAASRARIVAASDETRRRIERDLHDGTQQRLVSLGLELRLAQGMVPAELAELETEIARIADELKGVLEDLREISRGHLPGDLVRGRPGIGPADAGAPGRDRGRARCRRDRAAARADRDGGVLRRPEALTNATRHAHASVVEVATEACGGTLRVRVRDDGAGGAEPLRGSGLAGLKDRTEALGGTFSVHSPAGRGTTVSCELPVVAGVGQPDAGPTGPGR